MIKRLRQYIGVIVSVVGILLLVIVTFGDMGQAVTDNWYGLGDLLNALDTYKGKGEGAELIAHFHGHLHNFRAEKLGTNEVLSITVPNACYERNNEYGTAYTEDVAVMYGDVDDNGNQRVFNKTANTAQDTAFNVIVVEQTQQILRSTEVKPQDNLYCKSRKYTFLSKKA